MPKRILVFFIFVTAFVGCSKGPSVATYPATGTVMYNGKPLARATIMYVSNNPDAPRATGITDSDGRFSLNTYVSAKELLRGALPGEYEVAVIKQASEMQQAPNVNWDSMSPDERAKQMNKMWADERQTSARGDNPSKKQSDSEIPKRYADPKTSGLTAVVVVGENEPREFKLTDD